MCFEETNIASFCTEHNVPSPLWASERLSTTTASDNEMQDKADNLRVESRPSLARYMDQVGFVKAF